MREMPLLMKKITEMNPDEFKKLNGVVLKRILGKYNSQNIPYELQEYFDEVMGTIRRLIKWEVYRHERLKPIIDVDLLPYFVIKWLQENGFSV